MATNDPVTLTDAAREHTPTGDPEHVAYGADYYWRCSCGASAGTLTTQDTATARGENHAAYCDGRVTIEVVQ